jgi:HAE1 family hydrophobic/amphiphilic exporter-1
VEFTIRGPDWDTLGKLSKTFQERMESSGLMREADSDYRVGMPEVSVVPNRDRAAARGVRMTTIANTINAMIGGVRSGKYTRGGKRYDIRVRLVANERRRPDDIQRIFVRNDRGELVSLSEVVAIKEKMTLLSINRKNRERAVSVFANVAPGVSQGEALSKVQALAKDVLPDGYRIVLSGSAQTFKESGQSLLVALVLGIFVAYMVLGAQFNSFVHPLTVLLALPFSVTGAFLALQWMGISLNIYSVIGLLLLMGLVKKNLTKMSGLPASDPI